jgi:hypothetical protein
MITRQFVFPLKTVMIDYSPEPGEVVAFDNNLYVLENKLSVVDDRGNVSVYYFMKKTERTKQVL